MAPLATSVHDGLPQLPTFNTSLGAILLCTVIGCMFYGLMAHQTSRYFTLYPTDFLALKLLVLLVFVVDTVHTATTIHVCYYYLVNSFFDIHAATHGVWSLWVEFIETSAIMIIAHGFYARRLFLLSKGSWVPVVSILVVLASELGFSIAATVELFRKAYFAYFFKFNWMLWGCLISAFLVDVLATSFLTYVLRNSRTLFRKTNSTIDVLIVYGINTGLSTSIITLVSLICAVAMPHTLVFYGINIISAKMYANSLLAVLNSRRSITDKDADVYDTGSFGLQVFNPHQRKKNGEPRPQAAPPLPRPLDDSAFSGIVFTSDSFLPTTRKV
ncbi:hypothetical protein C8Q80DRAFT_1165586 [Daedaleopsis nitida]|nr:hypothetical protein C8Q80DRAFT_1165586 [Daedaleopsis nitida]